MSNQYEEQLKKTSTCPICGKKFVPAPEHAWKIGSYNTYTAESDDGRRKHVCSYSCMRKWEKEQEEKLKNRKYTRS